MSDLPITLEPTAPTGRPMRHLHPLTPFLRGWALLGGLGAVLGQDSLRHLRLRELGIGLAVAVPLVLAYGFFAWRMTRYGIVDGDLRHEQGILFRRSRRVRLDRLQSVDVVRPFIARLLGLAELRLEVAGGHGPEAPLAYLSERDALALRAELLARAAGLSEDTPEAPERILHHVPPVRLALSLLLMPLTVISGLAFGGLVVAAVLSNHLLASLPVLIGVGSVAVVPVRRFIAHFDFTVAESPDGLRLRYGLLETRAQTVPPGRVQAVRLVRPGLWRLFGDWASVEVDVAGYAQERSAAQASVLLPVAPLAVVAELLARVLPGVDVDAVAIHGVPKRARLLDPLAWRRLGAGADASVFVARRGRLRHELDIIPHAKPQSLRVTQGWLQHRLGLASVHLDTTPGPVRVHAAHRDVGEAVDLVLAQAARSHAARIAAPHERWMTGPPHRPPQHPGA